MFEKSQNTDCLQLERKSVIFSRISRSQTCYVVVTYSVSRPLNCIGMNDATTAFSLGFNFEINGSFKSVVTK